MSFIRSTGTANVVSSLREVRLAGIVDNGRIIFVVGKEDGLLFITQRKNANNDTKQLKTGKQGENITLCSKIQCYSSVIRPSYRSQRNKEATGATPMLCLIYIIFIIVALYYASQQGCPRMAATAAALRQIWSGGCQSCRNSEVSGLSGLEPPASSGTGARNVREACVCDVCPCTAIDVVVRTTSPVAIIFDDVMNLLNLVYCYLLTTFIGTYEMFSRVLECRTACRQQAQILEESHYDSAGKFSFDKNKSAAVISKKTNLSFTEQDFNKSITSSRQQSSLKVKDEPLLRLLEKISDEELAAKTEEKAAENMTLTVASEEIEPTIAVERTPKVATEEKGVDMHFDEESFGTEEKGVGIRADAESLPSSSREGSSYFSDRSWHRKVKGSFQVSDEKKKPDSPVASQTYCDKCKEQNKVCVPSCPNASCQRCKEAGKLCVASCPKNSPNK